MSISYAYIRYLKDQEREIVNVNHIKNFHPEHELDFIPNKAYMVQWLAIDSDDETEIDSNLQDPDSWYKAQILLLAGKLYLYLFKLLASLYAYRLLCPMQFT